jgi:lipoate---protein ligase
MIPLLYPDTRPSPWPTGEDVGNAEPPPFRVWIPQSPLLVLGYSQDPEAELYLDAVTADSVVVYKRRGGGGAVWLDGGVVCVAIRFSRREGFGIHDYFREGNGLLARVVRDSFGIEALPRGISDLAVGERKISGSSLYMPRECALYLASILVSTPPDLLDRYLRHPSREPEYRGGRSHADFVVNLSELDARATPERVREAVEREMIRDQEL